MAILPRATQFSGSPGAVVRGWELGRARALREHGEREAETLLGGDLGPRPDG